MGEYLASGKGPHLALTPTVIEIAIKLGGVIGIKILSKRPKIFTGPSQSHVFM